MCRYCRIKKKELRIFIKNKKEERNKIKLITPIDFHFQIKLGKSCLI